MLKRIALALLCASAVVATSAAAADVDTKPTVALYKECSVPHGSAPVEVTVRFKVTETGAIEDMTVVKSSGDTSVDERVAKCVASFTYKPATHNGVPVAAYTTHDYRSADIRDMTGAHHAFAGFERDIDRRCHKLYPIDRRLDLAGQPITLVAVARLASGEIQTKIMQSAGSKPDAQAVKCVLEIIKDHDDLPATFVRTFSINWAHR